MKRNGDILVTQSKSALDLILDVPQVIAPSSNFPNATVEANIYFIDNLPAMSSDQPIDLANVDTNGLRDKLADMVEAYDKCNALLFGANIQMPFPTYEISIYVFMIAMVIICMAILTFKLEPFKQLKNIRLWRRVIANHKRNKHAFTEELEINMCDDPKDLAADTDLIVKILTVIMIPIATMLFTAQLISNTSALSSALYGSNLYRSNNCYNI